MGKPTSGKKVSKSGGKSSSKPFKKQITSKDAKKQIHTIASEERKYLKEGSASKNRKERRKTLSGGGGGAGEDDQNGGELINKTKKNFNFKSNKRKFDDISKKDGEEGASTESIGKYPTNPHTSSASKGKTSSGIRGRAKHDWKTEKAEKKPHSELIGRAKQLWETLRVKNLDDEKRAEVNGKLLDQFRGKIAEVTLKHDASRIVQACFKYGNTAQRGEIIEELKDHILELAKSKYGHHLARKLIKYAPKAQIPELIKPFQGKFRILSHHKQASSVIEYIYREIYNGKQKREALIEFYGPEFAVFKGALSKSLDELIAENPTKKKRILALLKESIDIYIAKNLKAHSLTHRIVLDYLLHADQENRAYVIETLKDSGVEMLSTREGMRVLLICLSYGTAKGRKTIVKTMKAKGVMQLCKDERGSLAVIRAIQVTDDTVFVKTSIISEVTKHLDEIACDQFGKRVILHALMEHTPLNSESENNNKETTKSTHFFSRDVLELLQPTFITDAEGNLVPTSKKVVSMKRVELMEMLLVPLFEASINNPTVFLTTPNATTILIELFKSDPAAALATAVAATGDSKDRSAFIEQAEAKRQLALEALVNTILSPAEVDILEHPTGHRTVKQLIGTRNFGKLFLEKAKGKLASLALFKHGSFVICALLENPDTQDETYAVLKGSVKDINGGAEAGTKLIAKLMAQKASGIPIAPREFSGEPLKKKKKADK